jgi:hypothetical protein
MTVPTSNPQVTFSAAGVGPYAVPFPVSAPADVRVAVRPAGGVASPADFLLSGTNVTLTAAPPAGALVVVWRETPDDQPLRLADLAAFPAAPTERALDRLALRDQELRADLGRALRVPVGATAPTMGPIVPGGSPVAAGDGSSVTWIPLQSEASQLIGLVRTVATPTHGLSVADLAHTLLFTNVAGCVVSLPAGLPVGFAVILRQWGGGAVTVQAGAGATLAGGAAVTTGDGTAIAASVCAPDRWALDGIEAGVQPESIAALRAATSATLGASMVQLPMSHRAGDGGGLFARDPADTTSADDGGVTIVDASGRRWKRVANGDWQARWWNVRNDGVAVDRAALQAALTAAGAIGARLVFAPGRYRLDVAAGTLAVENVTIVGAETLDGAGYGQPHTDRGTVFEIVGTSASPFTIRRGVTFRGVQFFYPDQPDSPTPTVYPPTLDFDFTAGPVQFVEIDRCAVFNAFDFVALDDPAGQIGHVRVTKSYLFAFRKTIDIHNNLERIEVTDTSFTWGFWTAATLTGAAKYARENGVALQYRDGDGIWVTDNLFFGHRDGMRFDGGTCIQVNISGNKFDQVRFPVRVEGPASLSQSRIVNNQFLGFNATDPALSGTAILFNATGGPDTSMLIEANTFAQTRQSHIAIQTASAGVFTIGANTYDSGALGASAGPHAAVFVNAPAATVRVAGGTVSGPNTDHYSGVHCEAANRLEVHDLHAAFCWRAINVVSAGALIVTGCSDADTRAPTSIAVGLVPGPRHVAGNLWQKPPADADEAVHAAAFGVRAGQAAAINDAAFAAAFAAAKASAGKTLILPPGDIEYSTTRTWDAGVLVKGAGRGGYDDAAGMGRPGATRLIYTGTGVGVTRAPPSVAGGDALRGGGLIDFDLVSSTGTTGLDARSSQGAVFRLRLVGWQTACMATGVVAAALGEAKDFVGNELDLIVRPGLAGDGLVMDGDPNANSCKNLVRIYGTHRNGVGLRLKNSDSNDIAYCKVFRTAGTGKGVVMEGGASAVTASRANVFSGLLEPGDGGIHVQGAASGFAVASTGNRALAWNQENNFGAAALVAIDAGAEFDRTNANGDRIVNGVLMTARTGTANSVQVARASDGLAAVRVTTGPAATVATNVTNAGADVLSVELRRLDAGAASLVVSLGGLGSMFLYDQAYAALRGQLSPQGLTYNGWMKPATVNRTDLLAMAGMTAGALAWCTHTTGGPGLVEYTGAEWRWVSSRATV